MAWPTDAATLVTAINTANLDAALDVTTLGADITLKGSLPAITEDLEIVGNTFTIDTDAVGYCIFHDTGAVANIDLTFTGVTVSGAFTADAIDTSFSNVTISNSVFDNAPVDIAGSGVTVMVTFSTFDNAPAPLVDGFRADVDSTSHVTFTDSRADESEDQGIEIDVDGAGNNITASESSADGNGEEGFWANAQDGAAATLSHVTASLNTEGGLGVYANTGTVTARDS